MQRLNSARAMGSRIFAGVVLGGMMLGGSAMAQNAEQAPPRVGQTFGDWLFECTALGEGQTACSLTQTIVVQETGRPIAKFSLARGAAAGQGFLVVMLPLGLDIPAGVQAAIDGNTPFPLAIETCIAGGCLASLQVDAARLNAMKSGTNFNIAFRMRGDAQPVQIAGSLNGITAGVAAARIE
ncbi:MAG: invasion associated locus B family protein [Devosia sp.]